MVATRLRALLVGAGASLALSGCMSLGGYGYADQGGYYNDGGYYGGSGYGDPYGAGYGGYDSYGYGAGSYYGWYDNFYYPGTGFYVFDTYGQRHRWSGRQQRYWGDRLRRYSGERRENWSGYRNDRDRDGIRNRYDATPDGRRGRIRRDADRDGIRDRVDATPRGPNGRSRRDRNGDGVRDGAQRRGGARRGRPGSVGIDTGRAGRSLGVPSAGLVEPIRAPTGRRAGVRRGVTPGAASGTPPTATGRVRATRPVPDRPSQVGARRSSPAAGNRAVEARRARNTTSPRVRASRGSRPNRQPD